MAGPASLPLPPPGWDRVSGPKSAGLTAWPAGPAAPWPAGEGPEAGQAQALWDQLSKERGSSAPGASALTAAELRLLPLLSTHLSFPQIAQEMFLSRYTIKSEAMSIYRKLGVSSRSVQLGLLAG
jgi:DNA-binding CsgD family transcriptional regulator